MKKAVLNGVKKQIINKETGQVMSKCEFVNGPILSDDDKHRVMKFLEKSNVDEKKQNFESTESPIRTISYLQDSDSEDNFGDDVKYQVNENNLNDEIRSECGEIKIYNQIEEEEQIWMDFVLMFESDFVDDGLSAFCAIWICLILGLYKQEYWKAGIRINESKSTVIINTNNIEVKNAVAEMVEKEGMKVDYEGNVKYLGVAHGTDKFCNEFVMKRLDKLDIKMHHIKLFNNDYIRMNMLCKMYGFNRVNYMLRVQRQSGWMQRMMQTDRLLNSLIVIKLNYTEMMQFQLPLSSSKRCFGLRPPCVFEHAAKICSYKDKANEIAPYFLISKENFGNYSNNSANEKYTNKDFDEKDSVDLRFYDENLCSIKWSRYSEKMNVLFEREKDRIEELSKKHIKKFDEFIVNVGKYVPSMHKKHKNLIELIDKQYLYQIYSKGNEFDCARMKGLSNNGAKAWARAPYNIFFGMEYENSELMVLNSLILGCPIVRNTQPCRMCGKTMDLFGYHALSCPSGGGHAQKT